MKLNPILRYYTPKEMRAVAAAATPDGHTRDQRRIANEYAELNGFEKTRISISGVRRVLFYKPEP